jgi:hypothetical protein
MPGHDVWIEIPLAEQTRNRDHNSSDDYEQAAKQHNVTQEHTHTLASPLSSQTVPTASSAVVAVCSAEFCGRGVPSGHARPSGLHRPRRIAANADTAATAATCGRTDRLSMRGSPSITSPWKQSRGGGRGSSFLKTRPSKHQPVATLGLQLIGSDYLFLITNCREPDIDVEHC